MEITPLAPPSVQLVPAKEYNGAPIGTSYDVKAYVGEQNKAAIFLRFYFYSGFDEFTLIEEKKYNRGQ